MAENNNQLKQTSIDIEAARANPSFSISEMNRFFLGDHFHLKNKISSIVENEPLFELFDQAFRSREEQLAFALRVEKRMIELVEEHQLNQQEHAMLMNCVGVMTPVGLHYGAFMSVIEAQGTPEQIGKWYMSAKRHAVIGCYAQTELSHGSNVAGLKTVAVFDEKTDELVIHSPDLTAAKWWVGGLGVASTHAAVQAQLIVANKSYGPHIFIVPIRSPIDLKPYPGVTVGDIGPKAYGGFGTVDNGFALFDHVRIPRDNMLMRFSRLSRNGEYVPPVHNKLSYGGMVKLRVDIASDTAIPLSKAVTIASRYCTVRRQFGSPIETQVVSYSSVKYRLIPLTATVYAIQISTQALIDQFNQLNLHLAKNDASLLPELHISACALKSWCTRQATDGIETCRKAMGGHGYSAFSGLSDLFASSVPSNTYEGDNYVLSLQVARSLLKQLKKSSVFESAAYLKAKDTQVQLDSAEALLDPQVQLRLYELRAARLVKSLDQKLSSGRDWSDVNMECWDINFAHTEYLIVKAMVQRVATLPNTLAPIVKRLLDLFCLHHMCQSITFLSTRTISPSDLDLVQQEYSRVISDISRDLIPLTDAFGHTDRELNTALGQYDGRAYEALWNAVQKNPVNCDEAERKKLNNLVLEILHRGDNLKYIRSAKL